jgi:trigger factor
MTIEVPEERVQAQMRQLARSIAQDVVIPGFRKGKAPYDIVVRRVGEQALRADAIQEMIDAIVGEALDEVEVIPYAQPSLDDMELDPLVLKLTIPLEPVVVLSDYRALRREAEPIQIAEEAIAEELERVRVRHQVLTPVDRPAQPGDMVKLTGHGTDAEGGEKLVSFERMAGTRLLLDPQKLLPGVPFVENVAGMSAGDRKEFTIAFPVEYEDEDLAGKTVSFEIALEGVESRELPELNDELAKKEGRFETLIELRANARQELEERAVAQARSDTMEWFLDRLVEESELRYPPGSVESELESSMENFRRQVTGRGWKWEDYLALQGTTESAMRDNSRPEAEERLRRSLVFRQFILAEKLQIRNEDLQSALNERLGRFGDNPQLQDELRSVLTQGENFLSITNEVLVEKAGDRIAAILAGMAPDLAELDEGEPAAGVAGQDEEE